MRIILIFMGLLKPIINKNKFELAIENYRESYFSASCNDEKNAAKIMITYLEGKLSLEEGNILEAKNKITQAWLDSKSLSIDLLHQYFIDPKKNNFDYLLCLLATDDLSNVSLWLDGFCEHINRNEVRLKLASYFESNVSYNNLIKFRIFFDEVYSKHSNAADTTITDFLLQLKLELVIKNFVAYFNSEGNKNIVAQDFSWMLMNYAFTFVFLHNCEHHDPLTPLLNACLMDGVYNPIDQCETYFKNKTTHVNHQFIFKISKLAQGLTAKIDLDAFLTSPDKINVNTLLLAAKLILNAGNHEQAHKVCQHIASISELIEKGADKDLLDSYYRQLSMAKFQQNFNFFLFNKDRSHKELFSDVIVLTPSTDDNNSKRRLNN